MNLNLKYLTTTKNLWDGFKDEKLDHYEKLDFYGGGGVTKNQHIGEDSLKRGWPWTVCRFKGRAW